jgi:hypothetical protein
MDNQNLMLLGMGILIGLGFVTVMLLIRRQPQPNNTAPLSYVAVPQELKA